MKYLTTLTLVITLLISSCSVVKKNGYYQSRKYKPGKHILSSLNKETKPKKCSNLASHSLETSETLVLSQPPLKLQNPTLYEKEHEYLKAKTNHVTVSNRNIRNTGKIYHKTQFSNSIKKKNKYTYQIPPSQSKKESTTSKDEKPKINADTVLTVLFGIITLVLLIRSIIFWSDTYILFLVVFFILFLIFNAKRRKLRDKSLTEEEQQTIKESVKPTEIFAKISLITIGIAILLLFADLQVAAFVLLLVALAAEITNVIWHSRLPKEERPRLVRIANWFWVLFPISLPIIVFVGYWYF
jgi:hypothetical protein